VCDDQKETRSMTKDGDAMHSHDMEQPEHGRRPAGLTGRNDTDWQAARRAAAAGHARAVEHGAVLHLQRLAGNAGVGSLLDEDKQDKQAPSPVLDVVGKGGGSPMPTDLRVQMEAGLGADFGDVRIHDDGRAAASAQAVSAKAYTVGNDVVFNRGSYQPDTSEGRHTLAHELTHVVQQRSGPVDGTPTGDGVALSDPHDRFEQEAEATATSVARSTEPAPQTAAGPAVQRQEAEEEEEPVGQTTPLQRQDAEEEEEPAAAQATPLQRQEAEEEEPLAEP
jgi:hypothetical protein